MLEDIERLLAKLDNSWVFVEGKKDKETLQELGIEKSKIMTVSGHVRESCKRVSQEQQGQEQKVFILTDMDRRGEELAQKCKNELEAHQIKTDLTVRRRLAGMLGITFFEEAKSAYDEKVELAKLGKLE